METQTMHTSDVKTYDCCPPFETALWDDKIVEWNDKKFILGKVLTAFYMPLNFGHVVKDLMSKCEKAGAGNPENLGLSDHTSIWNMNIYMAVDKEVPGAQNVSLSGKYFTKVYEGDFKNTKSWSDDFDHLADARNLKVQKKYFWYTTCPKCAKKYGKNYVVIVGKVVEINASKVDDDTRLL